jgi:tetratricopeptide (TPR) repeat protein
MKKYPHSYSWFASIFLLNILTTTAVVSQNHESLQKAFLASYAAEADSNYQAAITPLQALYRADNYEINLRLGWLHHLDGQYDQSKNYYYRAMELMPYAIQPKFGYAQPLAALGNWDELISVYQDILKIAPQNNLAHYYLGSIYYKRQQYEEAYRHAEIVVNLYPFDYDALVLFGWVQLKMGNVAKARALFEKALLILPEGVLALEGMKQVK